MSALGLLLFSANTIVFLAIGHIVMIRLRETTGSLRLSKICVAMTAFTAAGAFFFNVTSQLVYQPTDYQNLAIMEMFIPANMFAMLSVAFVASFAIFAAYRGRGRQILVLSIFMVALMPTAYLMLNFDQMHVMPGQTDVPESYVITVPSLATILFALCGIPLAIVPVVAFSRMLFMARRNEDRVLSRRVAMMFSAVLLNEMALLVFVFGSGFLRLLALVAWIPIALFLLFAVLKITERQQGFEERPM